MDKYGFFGPSLDYGNPAAGDPLDMFIAEDGPLEFSMDSCNHGEVPLDPESEQNLQAILEDQGFFPPPWARFPSTFNFDKFDGMLEDEEAVYQADFAPYMEREMVANPPRSLKQTKHGFIPKTAADLRTLLKQKKPIGYTDSGQLFSLGRTSEELGLNAENLLGKNAKLSKGGKLCYLTAGLSLAPFTLSRVANLCPYATKGCSTGCLHVSGNAELNLIHAKKLKIISDVMDCRVRRTILLMHNNSLFARLFLAAMSSWERKAVKPFESCDTHQLCGRLNVNSDLPWEIMTFPFEDGEMTIFDRFPNNIWYDYTKNPHRMMKFIDHINGRGGDWPDNYYLTFSWSEVNAETSFAIMQAGGNVAIPFDVHIANPRARVPDLPEEYCGFPVINADNHDLRFLDYTEGYHGVFCGLHLKGRGNYARHMRDKKVERAKNLPKFSNTGGFFQYADEAGVIDGHYDPSMNITNSREYIEEIIEGSRMRAEEQVEWTQKMRSRFSDAPPPWWMKSEQE